MCVCVCVYSQSRQIRKSHQCTEMTHSVFKVPSWKSSPPYRLVCAPPTLHFDTRFISPTNFILFLTAAMTILTLILFFSSFFPSSRLSFYLISAIFLYFLFSFFCSLSLCFFLSNSLYIFTVYHSLSLHLFFFLPFF